MKKTYTFFIAAAMLFIGGQRASAISYEDINWSDYAKTLTDVVTSNESNPTYVYLYNVDENKFLTNGGEYGMEGILSNVAMRFYVTEKSSRNSTYEIHSTIHNSAHSKSNLVGMDGQKRTIYFDRASTDNSTNFSTWRFNNATAYTISQSISSGWWGTTTYYWAYESNKLIGSTTQNDADKWYIITYDDYKKVLESLTDTYVDVSGLILDSRFDRNSTDASNWTFSATTDSYIYTPYFAGASTDSQDEFDGAFVTARLGNEQVTLTQKITGLKAGRYRVTCQGFYSNGGNTNDCTYLTATGNGETSKSLLQTVTESDRTSLETYNKTNTTDETNRAIAAGKIFANNNSYSDGTEEDPYFNEVYVTVGEDGTLTLGIDKQCADGEVYVDNFRLFLINTTTETKLYLSANEQNEDNIDKNAYTTAYDCYLRRSFTQGAWEALCLPFDLTYNQVTEAFGSVELCELQGLKKNTMIVFAPVSVSASASAYVKANHCYVIKVNQDPDIAKGTATPEFTNKVFETAVTKNGPIYIIPDVKPDARESNEATGSAQTDEFTEVDFTCYYKKTTATSGTYVVNSGNMYRLTADGTAYATTWTLSLPNGGNAKALSIDGVDVTPTAISGVIINGEGDTDTKVYNLNGMAVGTAAQVSSLPKGVYIMSGKKFIVK